MDTDVILPAKYLGLFEKSALAKRCLEGLAPAFAAKVRPGDVIVAGKNFGCGSSREHAPLSIIGAGVSLVIARSFARIFFRNAVNAGLAILESELASERTESGDELRVDLGAGFVENLTKNERYPAPPFPPFIQKIIDAGGLLNSLKIGEER